MPHFASSAPKTQTPPFKPRLSMQGQEAELDPGVCLGENPHVGSDGMKDGVLGDTVSNATI